MALLCVFQALIEVIRPNAISAQQVRCKHAQSDMAEKKYPDVITNFASSSHARPGNKALVCPLSPPCHGWGEGQAGQEGPGKGKLWSYTARPARLWTE